MRTNLFIGISFISASLSSAAALNESDIKLLKENRNGSAQAIHALMQGLSSREEAVVFLREIRLGGTHDNNNTVILPGHAHLLLLNLGDREELAGVYRRYTLAPDDTAKGRVFQRSMGGILHPAFIPIIAGDLGRDSVEIRLSGEVDGWTVPYANAAVILNIILRSRFFSPAVESWGHGLEQKYGWDHPERYIADIRAFWAENAAHIEAGEYILVRPPSAVSKPPEDLNPPAAPAPVAPPPEPTPEPVKSSVAASVPTPAAAPEPAAKTNPVW